MGWINQEINDSSNSPTEKHEKEGEEEQEEAPLLLLEWRGLHCRTEMLFGCFRVYMAPKPFRKKKIYTVYMKKVINYSI